MKRFPAVFLQEETIDRKHSTLSFARVPRNPVAGYAKDRYDRRLLAQL
jgi:hypothetical protein